MEDKVETYLEIDIGINYEPKYSVEVETSDLQIVMVMETIYVWIIYKLYLIVHNIRR